MKPKNQFGIPQLVKLLFQSRLDYFSEGKFWHVRNINPANKRNLILAGLDQVMRPNTLFFFEYIGQQFPAEGFIELDMIEVDRCIKALQPQVVAVRGKAGFDPAEEKSEIFRVFAKLRGAGLGQGEQKIASAQAMSLRSASARRISALES